MATEFNSKAFWTIVGVGVGFYVLVLIIFGIITGTSASMDISLFDNPLKAIQDDQYEFLMRNFSLETSDFFNHLAQNSLAYMSGLFALIVIVLAFFLSRREAINS